VIVTQVENSTMCEMWLIAQNPEKKPKIAVIYHHGVVGVDGVDVMALRDTELETERS